MHLPYSVLADHKKKLEARRRAMSGGGGGGAIHGFDHVVYVLGSALLLARQVVRTSAEGGAGAGAMGKLRSARSFARDPGFVAEGG